MKQTYNYKTELETRNKLQPIRIFTLALFNF